MGRNSADIQTSKITKIYGLFDPICFGGVYSYMVHISRGKLYRLLSKGNDKKKFKKAAQNNDIKKWVV